MKENQIANELNKESSTMGSKETSTSQSKKKNVAKWSTVFGLFMIFIYFSMAYLTLCTNYFFWIQDWARYGLGTIFIIYGIWRGFRYFKTK